MRKNPLRNFKNKNGSFAASFSSIARDTFFSERFTIIIFFYGNFFFSLYNSYITSIYLRYFCTALSRKNQLKRIQYFENMILNIIVLIRESSNSKLQDRRGLNAHSTSYDETTIFVV